MKLDPPCKVSRDTLTFSVSEIEPILRGPAMKLEPYPPSCIELKDGSQMVIREARREEAPLMLEYMMKVMQTDHDFYDIVGARVYAEILGWYRHRLKDPYTLVGLIDGEWVGFANGRLMNKDVNISLHTMAMKRGLRIGGIMYYAKAKYGFEILGNKEWWATYESYNGWMRWGVGMAQPSYPWPDVQHELGGARVYYITNEYWESTVAQYLKQLAGAEIVRPVPEELWAKNSGTLRLPEEVMV
jgi:hypothetical protein